MINDDELKKHLFDLETKMANPKVRKSPQELDQLLADSFVEFGSSGKIYDIQKIKEELGAEQEIHIAISDFKIKVLSSQIVLVTYLADVKEKINSTESHFVSLRSSIWQLVDGKWQIVFHQGTKIAE
jgi:hypothetical protein